MQWKIITVGKISFPWAKAAFADYIGRLQRVTKVEHIVVKDGHRDQVEAQLIEASAQTVRIVLDERGEALRSLGFARWIEQQDLHGQKRASLLIGGADGHSDALRKSAHACWTLSSFTLQHEVALIVAAEQLYRAYSIIRGEPYHRE